MSRRSDAVGSRRTGRRTRDVPQLDRAGFRYHLIARVGIFRAHRRRTRPQGHEQPVITLRAGDHVCAVYDTDEQFVATVADFLADGNNE